MQAKEINKAETETLFSKLDNVLSSYKTHSQAIYTSRLLDFKNLPEPRNSKEINEQFYNLKKDLESSDLESAGIGTIELNKEYQCSSKQVNQQ